MKTESFLTLSDALELSIPFIVGILIINLNWLLNKQQLNNTPLFNTKKKRLIIGAIAIAYGVVDLLRVLYF